MWCNKWIYSGNIFCGRKPLHSTQNPYVFMCDKKNLADWKLFFISVYNNNYWMYIKIIGNPLLFKKNLLFLQLNLLIPEFLSFMKTETLVFFLAVILPKKTINYIHHRTISAHSSTWIAINWKLFFKLYLTLITNSSNSIDRYTIYVLFVDWVAILSTFA